ncbi:response regulator [Deferribacteraceae bacterium V6Fe1]|nr:response regulator [Deferribacteraceae bacterium V6Fe1]
MKRILIIDDSEFVRAQLLDVFNDVADVLFFEAENASDAEELLENEVVDLILLDVKMPGKSGVAFLKDLKSQRYYSELPVVMLTGMSEKDIVLDCLKSGASDFVVKDDFENIKKRLTKYFQHVSENNRFLQFVKVSQCINLKCKPFRDLISLGVDGETNYIGSDIKGKINELLCDVNNAYKLNSVEDSLEVRAFALASLVFLNCPICDCDSKYSDLVKYKFIGMMLGLFSYFQEVEEDEKIFISAFVFASSLFIALEYVAKFDYDEEIFKKLFKKESLMRFVNVFCKQVKFGSNYVDLENNEVKTLLTFMDTASYYLFDNTFIIDSASENTVDLSKLEFLKILSEQCFKRG